jgi:hypothetical protein
MARNTIQLIQDDISMLIHAKNALRRTKISRYIERLSTTLFLYTAKHPEHMFFRSSGLHSLDPYPFMLGLL